MFRGYPQVSERVPNRRVKVLTLNAGSNSLKFEVVATDYSTNDDKSGDSRSQFGRSLLSGAIDDIGKKTCSIAFMDGKKERMRRALAVPNHGAATSWVLDWIEGHNGRAHGVESLRSIERVGHRVVHGADQLTRPVQVTDSVIAQISALKELAPLHTDSVLEVIEASGSRLEVPMIAVIDSAFHRTIPDQAALYALPPNMAARHRIRRYGFHGISHQYLATRYAEIAGRGTADLNLVTLHLEGGSSAAAIERGKSVDTSMGFTPLEGLVMGSRCGDIDPGIVLYLMRKEGWDSHRAEEFLNKECGLKGVSGLSADTRKLRERLDEPEVKLACRSCDSRYATASPGVARYSIWMRTTRAWTLKPNSPRPQPRSRSG
jgi:acetate kinase